ncbi:plasmid pRiA4b ORF-3 family protein [Ornithinimicrobium flavum]|uniref:plasmid pRiA4b ORF-3 family protein n=1 Tax=Ornithinimicrobium flavum TaxID=1288636 RepID=UPI0010703862|nr:plasmid pRiA4b ORF-3 family protein [Ornithinimicrobium flavum]
MSDDKAEEIRRWVQGLSPTELQGVLDGIGGALGSFTLAPERQTHQMPELPDPPEETSALTVRVDVDDLRPAVWRRLVLRGDLLLDELHAVLQAAFGWQDHHLHKFWPGPQKRIWRGPSFLTEFDLSEGEEGVPESEVQLDQLLRAKGDRLFYTYDFGDDWTCTLRLEAVGPLDDDAPQAVCTGGRMAGPLEDCGGVPGHQELVEAYLADPSLRTLDRERRDWVPTGWDPTAFDLEEVGHRLSLVGLTTDELLERLAQPGTGASFPEVLEPLLDLALPPVVAELAGLVEQARTGGEPSTEDLAEIARPYRFMVELAGQDGIPLTSAGWMKPAFVERIYHELGLADDWIGKGNREDLTAPVADLRSTCQELGLLRRYKGRLVRTPLARGLSTDEEYVDAVAGRLLRHRNTWVEVAGALLALLTAAEGGPSREHDGTIARILTDCGLRTTPGGVDRRHVAEWVRPVSAALRRARGERLLSRGGADHDHRAVVLTRRALWPGEDGPVTA